MECLVYYIYNNLKIYIYEIKGRITSAITRRLPKYQGAGKRPAAQERKIVKASPFGRCPRPEGPRAAEQASRCSSFFFFFFFFSSVHYIKM